MIIGTFVAAILVGAILALLSNRRTAAPPESSIVTAQTKTKTVQPLPLIGSVVPISATPIITHVVETDAYILNESGKALMAQGRYAQAETLFQQAVTTSSSFYEPYNNLAFCLYERGAIADAINNWQMALAIYSDSPDANAGLGMALFASGRKWEGIALYQRAIAIDPQYANERWMHDKRQWSSHALENSRALR